MNKVISRICFSLSVFLVLSFTTINAQADAAIEGLQSPAWVTRDNTRIAIKPGMALYEGDELGTGVNGKLLIRTSEGSQVKLGENAQFAIKELQPETSDKPFRGLWSVLRGAFRFTTTAVGKGHKRAIDINVGVATAGIRGTDLWGKSNNQQDLICLIEGKIDVSREGQNTIKMKPLTVYRTKRSAIQSNVSNVDMEELGRWALETELAAGEGVLNESGRYRVNVMTADNIETAERARREYEFAGYPADILSIKVKKETRYRLGISGLASYGDAQSLAKQLAKTRDADDAWVSLVW